MSYWTLEGLSPALFGDSALRGRVDAARNATAMALRTIITRRGLIELDERALADVGLTHAEALNEARRAPWDLGNSGRAPRQQPGRPQSVRSTTVATLRMRLREAMRRRRSRMAITDLDQRMLKDIGISYSEAEFEANKAFWRR